MFGRLPVEGPVSLLIVERSLLAGALYAGLLWIGEGSTYISPAFGEEPPDLIRVLRPLYFRRVCRRESVFSRKTLHDECFALCDLDVGGGDTMAWITRIRAADVGHLGNHVG